MKTKQNNTGQASNEAHADGELRNSHKERRCGETQICTQEGARPPCVFTHHHHFSRGRKSAGRFFEKSQRVHSQGATFTCKNGMSVNLCETRFENGNLARENGTLGFVPPARCLTESGWGGRAQGSSIDSWEAGACGRSLLIMCSPCTAPVAP